MKDEYREIAFLILSFLLALFMCTLIATDPLSRIARPLTVFDSVNERVSEISD